MHSSVAQDSQELRRPQGKQLASMTHTGSCSGPHFDLFAQPPQVVQLLRYGGFRVLPNDNTRKIGDVSPQCVVPLIARHRFRHLASPRNCQ